MTASEQRVLASAAVDARDLWFSYGAGRPVLRGVSLTARTGEITMVIGASGGGKTTLLKLCKGLLAPERGSITVLGQPLTARRGRLDKRVAYIPQQLGIVRNLSVLDNALTGALGRAGTLASLFGVFPAMLVEQARSILDQLGIGHKAGEKVYQLSGGERQRVAIARALMQQPGVMLADEFISQLDPATSAEIMEVMRGIARRGVALVMTTHEMDIVARYADRVIVLRDGQKVLDCPGWDVKADELALLMRRNAEMAAMR